MISIFIKPLVCIFIVTIPTFCWGIKGDIDRDGDVDFSDFFLLSDNFGKFGAAELSDCSSSDLNDSESTDNEPDAEFNTTGAFETGGDITGALAFSRSGDCTTYANNYVSDVTDLISGNTLAGDVTISVSGSKCVFNTNAIPNHDMGEGGNFATSISAQNLSYEITTSPLKTATPTTNIRHTEEIKQQI